MAVRSLRGGAVVPVGAVRIDRKSRWGNPFPMACEADRAKVIDQYREWLWAEIRLGKIPLADLAALHGKDLYCWCSPKNCHGDVLAEAAAWAHGELSGTHRIRCSAEESQEKEATSIRKSLRLRLLGPTRQGGSLVNRLYEIVNPSDPYTFRAPDLATASIAMLFLGEWRFPGKPVDGEGDETPFFPFGCSEVAMQNQVLDLTGGTLADFVLAHREDISECLASVLIGGPGDRAIFESAMAKMAPDAQAIFRDEWTDRKRSSMNNLGKRAQQLAAQFRAA